MQLSQNFTLSDLTNCSDTQQEHAIPNEPVHPETLISLKELAENILEPIQRELGKITLTYGFCSNKLSLKINRNDPPGIYPKIDQHAGNEVNSRGKTICERLGIACDFTVEDYENRMDEVAIWIVTNLPYDRLYYYGKDRPLHVSVGPDNSKIVVTMGKNKLGNRAPKSTSYNEQALERLKNLEY